MGLWGLSYLRGLPRKARGLWLLCCLGKCVACVMSILGKLWVGWAGRAGLLLLVRSLRGSAWL